MKWPNSYIISNLPLFYIDREKSLSRAHLFSNAVYLAVISFKSTDLAFFWLFPFQFSMLKEYLNTENEVE